MVLLRILLLLLSWPAHAGGRGGHSTAWDPNLFPGATITTINCNGATDSAALAAFVSAGVAANPSPQVLRLAGPRCNFESNNGLVWNGTLGGPAVKNTTIWGYGTRITSNVYIGGDGVYSDNLHNAKIQSATAGATTVTLITASEASKFAVGDWALVAGLELQGTGGYPPNFQFFEYKLITANSGTGTGIITFSGGLKNSYLSTWPVTFAGSSSLPQTGPASIYLMPPGWNINVKVLGLEMPSLVPPSTVIVIGRDVMLMDITWKRHSPSPTQNANAWFIYNNFGSDPVFDQAEFDKNVDAVSVVRSFGNQILFQSVVANTFTLTSSQFAVLNGSAINTRIDNSVIDLYVMGPVIYGHGVSINAVGSTITTARPSAHTVNKTLFSFSAGTFSVANANPSVWEAWSWGIPGMKYDFVYDDGTIHFCNLPFTITAVTQDVTNTNYVTDLVGALPTPSCSGNPYNKYLAYPAATVTQRFTGPADLTQFAAPP
jgi:hypothetical protein